jgi:hypothetical protein
VGVGITCWRLNAHALFFLIVCHTHIIFSLHAENSSESVAAAREWAHLHGQRSRRVSRKLSVGDKNCLP